MDLPGIYSLSPYTLEEVVARTYLISERPDAILNIVDGTNLERNLYLTTQLLELGIPVVMAVNMMDIVKKNGDTIKVDQLKKELGCEVVEISALKGTGITEAANKAVQLAEKKVSKQPVHKFRCRSGRLTGADRSMLLGSDIPEEQKRFYAIKLFERDDKIAEQHEDLLRMWRASSQKQKIPWMTIPRASSPMSVYNYISSIISKCY